MQTSQKTYRTRDGSSRRMFGSPPPGDRRHAPPAFKPGDARQYINGCTWYWGPEKLEEREIEFFEGGELVHAKGLDPIGMTSNVELPRRGSIREFSRGSRRRMLQLMGKIDKRQVLPNFLTVTYGADFPTSAIRVKRDLDVFGKALKREYPGICFFWRMEFQKRGAPHLHFLVWHGPQIIKKKGANLEVFYRLAELWVQTIDGTCAELAASTRYERIDKKNGVYYYLSKYLGKVEQSEGQAEHEIADLPGRFWGVIGRDRLQELIHRVAIKTRVSQWMTFKNRLAWILKENGYSHVKAWGPWMGLSAYLESKSVAGILRGLGLLPGGVHVELAECPF